MVCVLCLYTITQEIQELRHVDDSISSGDASLAIERALGGLMESIMSVSSSLEEVNTAMAPLLESVKTPTQGQAAQWNEHEPVLRKHASLLAEWQTVQVEVSRLRSELQEDQLLVRFRTAVDQVCLLSLATGLWLILLQAAGMMDSLDKAVEACQVRLFFSRVMAYLNAFFRSSSGGVANLYVWHQARVCPRRPQRFSHTLPKW